MTNKELQELLATYPPDALVTVKCYTFMSETFWIDINETHISIDNEGDIIIDVT